MMNSTIRKNTIWSIASELLAKGGIVLATMLVSRAYPVENYNQFAYYVLTVTTLGAYLAFGFGTVSSRLYAEANVSDNSVRPSSLIEMMYFLLGLIVLVVSIILLILPDTFVYKIFAVERKLLLFGIVLVALESVPRGAVVGLEIYSSLFWISLISTIMLIFGIVLISVLEISSFVIYAFIFSKIFFVLLMYSRVLFVFPLKFLETKRWMNRASAKVVGNLSFKLFLISAVSVAIPWMTGRLVFSYGADSIQFTKFSIAFQWYTLVLFIPGVVSRVLLPKFIQIKSTNINSSPFKYSLQYKSIGLNFFIALLVSAVVLILTPIISSLYGEHIELSRIYLLGFLIAAVISSPFNILGNIMHANHLENKLLLITILSFVTSLLYLLFSLVQYEAVIIGYEPLILVNTINLVFAYIVLKRKFLI